METTLDTIRTCLSSTDSAEVRRGLQMIREEIARVGSEEARPLFEMVSTLFYIDPLDEPRLAPLIDEAISLVTGFGDWVIPVLVANLDEGDLKAQMASAEALGRIGADAVEPLITKFRESETATTRAFALYALGKIRSPHVARAEKIVTRAAVDPDLELRDTATRVIGRFATNIPAERLSDSTRRKWHEILRTNLADENRGVRAKAVRSMGKMLRHGYLTEAEKTGLETSLCSLLGLDDRYDWDRAFVVRKEAAEALAHLRAGPRE